MVERLDHIVGSGAVDLDGGVAPAGALELVHARRPLAADADAPCNSDAAVHNQQLSVVARHEPEPGAEARRVEDGDRDPGPPQLLEEPSGCATGADPVEQQTHVHPSLDRGNEPVGEALAYVVGAEDVALERDARLGAVDQVEHRVEGGRPVAQQGDAVPARYVGSGDAPQTTGKRRTRDDGHIPTAPVGSKIASRECHTRRIYTMRA